MEFRHLTEVLNRYGQEFVNGLQMKLLEDNSNASGNLVNSLRFIVDSGDGEFSVSIGLEEYWKYVDKGRGPGKFPPIDKIREWIEIKPVLPTAMSNGKVPTVNQLAFLIARKISLFGTEGTNFFTDTQISTDEQFVEAIKLAIEEDLGEETDTILMDLKF